MGFISTNHNELERERGDYHAGLQVIHCDFHLRLLVKALRLGLGVIRATNFEVQHQRAESRPALS